MHPVEFAKRLAHLGLPYRQRSLGDHATAVGGKRPAIWDEFGRQARLPPQVSGDLAFDQAAPPGRIVLRRDCTEDLQLHPFTGYGQVVAMASKHHRNVPFPMAAHEHRPVDLVACCAGDIHTPTHFSQAIDQSEQGKQQFGVHVRLGTVFTTNLTLRRRQRHPQEQRPSNSREGDGLLPVLGQVVDIRGG